MYIYYNYDDHIFLKKIKNKFEKVRALFLYVFKLVCNCQDSVHYKILLIYNKKKNKLR